MIVIFIITVVAIWMFLIVRISRKVPTPTGQSRDCFLDITTTSYIGADKEDRYNIEKQIRNGNSVYVDPSGSGAYISLGDGVMYRIANVKWVAEIRPEDLWRNVR